jgi:hypothetical protein
MSNLHLELSFTTEELVSPVARIYVKSSTGKEGDPLRYVSPDCASPRELDEAVDFLKAELEGIRKRGHAKFNASKGL